MNKDKPAARGFTIIELVIAMAIGMVVLGALYSLFSVQNRTFLLQEQIVEMQQNARSGMEIMLRDMRMAGYNPQKITPWISGTEPGLTSATANSLSYVEI
jgi:type IV pilus assembly protein PilW